MYPVTKKVLDAARADLGMVEDPANSNRNAIVTWYNANIAKIGAGPWCAMSVTHWMYMGGAKGIITGHALVDAFVRDAVGGHKGMTWHWGTKGIAPGDLAVFDWSLPFHQGTRSLTEGDHIGIVERVGTTVGTYYTIEGNYQDICQRVKRDGRYTLGYCRPKWSAVPGQTLERPWVLVPYPGHQHADSTRDDHHVYQIQTRLKQLGFYKGAIDRSFGPATTAAVKAFQKSKRLSADGWVGRNTWKALNIYSR